MESYVLRIYKRERKPEIELEIIRGVVEDTVSGMRWGFDSIEQLWAILASTPGDPNIKNTTKNKTASNKKIEEISEV